MKNLYIFNYKNLTNKDSAKRIINKLNIKTHLEFENKALKKSLIFSEKFNLNNFEHYIENNKNRLEDQKDFIKIFMNKIKLNKLKKDNQPIKPLFHTKIKPFNLSKSYNSIHYNTNIKNIICNDYNFLNKKSYKNFYNKNIISLKRSISQLTISNSDSKKFININENKLKKKLNEIHYKNKISNNFNYYSQNNKNHSIYKLIYDIEKKHKHNILRSFSTENITTQEPSTEINSYIIKPISLLKSKSNDKKYISNKYFMTGISRFIKKNSHFENLDKTKEYLKYLNNYNYK
jgi:hypothetical protein